MSKCPTCKDWTAVLYDMKMKRKQCQECGTVIQVDDTELEAVRKIQERNRKSGHNCMT